MVVLVISSTFESLNICGPVKPRNCRLTFDASSSLFLRYVTVPSAKICCLNQIRIHLFHRMLVNCCLNQFLEHRWCGILQSAKSAKIILASVLATVIKQLMHMKVVLSANIAIRFVSVFVRSNVPIMNLELMSLGALVVHHFIVGCFKSRFGLIIRILNTFL